MKEIRKQIRRLCVMISGICLLFFTIRVYAASGIIEIQLEDLKSKYSQRGGVVLALHQVGEVSADGMPSIDPIYGIDQFPHNAEETQKAAEQIMAKGTGKPIGRQKTDADGRLTFSGLENGVYLICAESSEKYGTISPILAFLPYYEVVDGEKTGPLYSLKVQPKASKPDAPEPSVIPSATPEITPSQGGPGGSGSPGGHGVKTGDDTNIIGYLILFIAAGGMAAFLIRRKGKGASE